jgi:adenylate kinase
LRPGFILDGYPRTLVQADAVEAMLNAKGMKLDSVIELLVDDKALVGRIVKRAEEAAAAGQPVRKDDNPEVFEERLREYYKKTAPLTGYYYAKGSLRTVDGMLAIDAVTEEIESVLASLTVLRAARKISRRPQCMKFGENRTAQSLTKALLFR